ncbi:MAG: beta-L-arabinofuranosidase domain-containing protein [Candidatus Latescibacterota bacterium]
MRNANLSFSGKIGELASAITERWLLPLPLANPDMLEMFRNRNRKPSRNLLYFSSEFAGKYLTGAVQIYRLNHDERLKKHISWFVGELLALQAENGYLGPWPDDCQLTGNAPNSEGNSGKTWDAWGHYHIMLGLLFWYEQSGDKDVLESVIRIADLFCDMFLFGDRRMGPTGSEDANLAPIHAFCLLYEITGHRRYIDLSREIEKDFELPPTDGYFSGAGDYMRTALRGLEFYDISVPHGRRWEGIHSVQGIGEMYFATGEEKYRSVFEHIWWSIVKLDRHNNGGFSSSEAATGNPYCKKPIETCATIAWMALSVDMLRMTGDSKAADELELSLLNSGIGLVSPSSRWWTYNTPMEGMRKSFTEDTLQAFHGRPGTSELSCCSTNGPRAIGLLSDWCIMTHENGLALNYFGECTMEAVLPSGNPVQMQQNTDYPASGEIACTISPRRKEEFAVNVRIPYWSARTVVKLNNELIDGIMPGRYLEIKRRWEKGDKIQVSLDMSLHYWYGERECEGKCSIFRGPIVLAYDTGFNNTGHEDVPRFDALNMVEKPATIDSWFKPWQAWEVTTVDCRKITLCDFASAGFVGYPDRTWFDVRNVQKAGFSKGNPLRTSRPR